MDRVQVYPGAIPLETDILNTNKNTMVALGKLVGAIFGTSTFASGLACVPTAPPSMTVSVGAGEIYSLQNIDGTAYSSLAADTTHQIMKQGIRLDAGALACAAPATSGNSIAYLIQAAFSDVDSDATVLPYYNASNPSQAYSGPANAGTTNYASRKGSVVLSVKAGVSATTGSQVTPAPDSGYVGLWVVTVANGATSITAGNIAQYASAPFVGRAALLNLQNDFTVSPTVPTPASTDNTTKAVNSIWAKLGFSSSFGTSGYVALPTWLGGLMFQWANISNLPTATANAVVVNWPTTFPNAIYASCFTPDCNQNAVFSLSLVSRSVSGLSVYCNNYPSGGWGTTGQNTVFAIGR